MFGVKFINLKGKPSELGELLTLDRVFGAAYLSVL